jgi:hypothetical protein
MEKRTRIILSAEAREKIRLCSSGLTGEEWAEIPMDEKKEYVKKLELAVEEIMLMEPDSFTRRALAQAKDVRDRRLARKYTHVQANVQEEV